MKVYLAGPMRGIEQFNFPAFDKAAKRLRGLGHEVFSPAERDIDKGFDGTKCAVDPDCRKHHHMPMTGDENLAEYGFSLREALADDVAWITQEAEAVYLLPGWRQSLGATAERALAEALGLTIVEIFEESR